MNKISIIIALVLSLICLPCFPQGFSIDEFEANLSDITASTKSRLSQDGNYCGLIKVQSNIDDMLFVGNVVGDVSNSLNEYCVYVENGSKSITIARPGYLPLSIQFSDYGIDAIGSKQTYTMKLTEHSLPDKNIVTIHVTPRDAEVIIDNIPLLKDDGGGYKIHLPKGEHFCSFRAVGYLSDTKRIEIGKEGQSVDVSLISRLQDVLITCPTSDAEIFVEQEQKAVGSWRGKLLPGVYDVEARKAGCMPWKRSFTVGETGRQTMSIPALSPITCKVMVSTTPTGMPVFVDGQWVGNSPCVVNKLSYGSHVLSSLIDTLGLVKEKQVNFEVEDIKDKSVSIFLCSEQKYQVHQEANEKMRNADILSREHWIKGRYIYKYDYVYSHLDDLEVPFFKARKNEWHMGAPHIFTYADAMCRFYKLVVEYLTTEGDDWREYLSDDNEMDCLSEHPLEYYQSCLYNTLKKVGPESLISYRKELCKYMGDLLSKEGKEEEAKQWYDQMDADYRSLLKQ